MKPDIFVTRPHLPPLEQFLPYLERIWASRVLTNRGGFHEELESKLTRFLGAGEVALVSNGTLGLLTALQCLNIEGEVITTPFTFVATSNALLWNRLKPVFVDIDPQNLNIDPEKIRAAVNKRTSAILAVHCYGNPCDTKALADIAAEHGLRVIYDACHAFGVEDAGGSVLRHGDLSVLSFHATKVFNTFEGGAIVCHSDATKERINHLRNFGFVREDCVVEAGINAKMSEFNAALGLVQLEHFAAAVADRARVDGRYREALGGLPGLRCLDQGGVIKRNYSYFSILVTDQFRCTRDDLYHELRTHGIFARRYFYPLVSEFPMYRHLESARRSNLPIAYSTSNQVLCLPIYPDLSEADQDRIIQIVHG